MTLKENDFVLANKLGDHYFYVATIESINSKTKRGTITTCNLLFFTGESQIINISNIFPLEEALRVGEVVELRINEYTDFNQRFVINDIKEEDGFIEGYLATDFKRTIFRTQLGNIRKFFYGKNINVLQNNVQSDNFSDPKPKTQTKNTKKNSNRNNVSFFDSFKLTRISIKNNDILNEIYFTPDSSANVIFGKNGYAKTYLLRLLASHLTQYYRKSDFFGETSFEGSEVSIDGEAKENVYKLPILAIPDIRYLNRRREEIKSEELDEEYFDGISDIFISQRQEIERLVNTYLFNLGSSYFDNNKSFEIPEFKLLNKIIKELRNSNFDFIGVIDRKVNMIQGTRYKIMVSQEVPNTIHIPIQAVSQGTMSVVIIFGLIYDYLRQLDKTTDIEVTRREGIVIVDEIDAHLHPSWQQKIIGLLTDTFPNVQFFVTAHNPLIAEGRKIGEVSVMRKSENGKFELQHFNRSFVGFTASELYPFLFEIEEKDENFLKYEKLIPQRDTFKERVLYLSNKEDITEEEKVELRKRQEDLFYIYETMKKKR